MKFELKGKVCVLTGGAGFLSRQFTQAILDAQGIVCLLDIDAVRLNQRVVQFAKKYPGRCAGFPADITSEESVANAYRAIVKKFHRVDALINNAANNPKMEAGAKNFSRLENFPDTQWEQDLAVGLTGSFVCAKVFGSRMAKQKRGVIVNMSSDLGIIAPDQRIYRKKGVREEAQPVKPVTYSVVKHGVIGLTKYLATYWAQKGIRVNALCPGGVYNDQPGEFVQKLSALIPLGRMARADEYNAAVLFLLSDASSYVTGATLIMDGGRTCW